MSIEHTVSYTPAAGIRLHALLPASRPAPPAISETLIQGLAIDSRKVQPGTLFFALATASSTDPAVIHVRLHGFIQQAQAQGAAVILSEIDPTLLGIADPAVIHISDLRQAIGEIARRFYQAQRPVTPARVIGVTGTNGKTTVTRLVAELLAHSGQSSAVLGTTGNGILPNLTPSSHTTVDALTLQHMLHDFAAQGATFACLEASSHGLEQGRLAATPIEVAIFTNLTRDHLDYHGTLEAYAEAKSRLFQHRYFPELRYAIVNAEDLASDLMLAQTPADVIVWRYAATAGAVADFRVIRAEFSLTGATLEIQTPQGPATVHSPLLGRFNVANLLAAIAGAMAAGLNLDQISSAIPHLIGAAGRMQLIPDDEALLIVDYAHTPDALTQVLASVRPHTTGTLTCVFGCGGDRDRGKRPLMTRAVLAAADHLIVTADNPRSETIDAIIADMLADLTPDERARITVEPDRRLAIRLAVRDSHPGDAVVVAGKGHEDYQEIAGVRHWFNDAVELGQARAALLTLPETIPAAHE